MKKILNLFLVSLAIVATSCSDDLDINTNPNTPPEINAGLALSAAEGSIATVLGGEFFNLGGMYAQYYTQAPGAGQYDEIERYNLGTDYANRAWSELYAGALNDLEYVKTEALASEQTGTYLIATTLQAYTYQYLVDLFGDVPYAEALAGSDNITPTPTPGEEVYSDLIASINEALNAYEANPVASDVENQDLIYNGNIDRWIEFANTLKLRLYIRMSETSQADAAAVTELLNEGNFLSQNAAFAAYEDAINKRNPFYDVQIDYLGNVNTVASNSLLEFYSGNQDPRISEVYTVDNEGIYEGIDQGAGLSVDMGGKLAKEYSRPNISATHPVFLLSVPESKFLQAEAELRYGSVANAEELYQEGIETSFELYANLEGSSLDLANVDAANFYGEGEVYDFDATADFESQLESIIVQKWAALANVNNLEAWIETLRTGYPVITDPEDPAYEEGRRIISLASILPGNQVPLSLYYPDLAVERNRNIEQKPDLLQPVWWNE